MFRFVLKKSKKEEGGDETPAPLLAKQPGLFNASGGGSGGYAENVLVYAAKELFGHTLRPEDIQCKAIKNNDYVEMSLLIDGECKLKFAKAYGFRNIQSVVQKIKKRTCAYQFVEIMACPLGNTIITTTNTTNPTNKTIFSCTSRFLPFSIFTYHDAA